LHPSPYPPPPAPKGRGSQHDLQQNQKTSEKRCTDCVPELSLSSFSEGTNPSTESEEYSSEDNSTGYVDSDNSELEELYESFDFEDEAAKDAPPSHATYQYDQTPLYSEARLTASQSSLLIFQYAIRHSLTTKAFTELLQLLSVHVPQGSALPKSVHHLKRNFLQAFPEAEAERQYYCECCQRSLPTPDVACTGGCEGSSSASFITVPLGPQLKKMMEDAETWSALQKRFERQTCQGVIRDIYDGEGYRQHLDFLSHPANVSLLLNTDGVAIYRSSNVSIWPVWAAVNELPPSLRFLRQHMLLLAIFYSKEKPVINMFLRPVIDDINMVYREGVVVHTPVGTHTARAIIINCSVDLPARAILLNMKQWNGKYGCLYCESPGTTLNGDHLHRYWPYDEASACRSHASVMHNAELATRTCSCVCGIKGPTVLALHPRLDLVSGVVIDDLHGIFLGVTLTLLRLWFDKTNRGKPYFIGNQIRRCDDVLLSIKVTDTMSRVPGVLLTFVTGKVHCYQGMPCFDNKL
jgi:hypothetical protein